MHLYVHHFILHVTDGFQDNEPLMRALSKLIYLNNPDLVLFVGEALVGNDAVDQLSKFNQVRCNIFNSSFVQLQLGLRLSFSHMSVIEPIYFVAETG
jgi:signal recognition particle GTPase